MTLFKELNLDQQILRAVEQMGFTEATPIQEKVIPFVKEGKDLIGQAQTVQGKQQRLGFRFLKTLIQKKRLHRAWCWLLPGNLPIRLLKS
ncbi:DEAD/DEAH box helicase [Thalassobacillus sp. C254]|uniref:DEAD/DEAH box helicase n=1 Tax=Thalassobacillus sp. C254 TaxID=1225341 RepID=UPI00277D0D56|nr:DEAD/DEAH box helicase [Thalassobacillus sp. C254]